MLYIIGLGLGSADDITLKGFNAVKDCDKVYLENYTSILCEGHDTLETFFGRSIILASREMVEDGCESILTEATQLKIGFLVVGDPFGATTHMDLMLRAKQLGVECRIIHNASIINAVGCCGLQLYSFGETVSIPFWTDTWQPDSFFPRIRRNKENGLHTLCLLDIKVKEPTLESLTKKKREYLPPRFMTATQAANQLQILCEKNKELTMNCDVEVVALARVGSESQKIVFCTLSKLSDVDMGKPLHSLVICGTLTEFEREFLEQYKL